MPNLYKLSALKLLSIVMAAFLFGLSLGWFGGAGSIDSDAVAASTLGKNPDYAVNLDESAQGRHDSRQTPPQAAVFQTAIRGVRAAMARGEFESALDALLDQSAIAQTTQESDQFEQALAALVSAYQAQTNGSDPALIQFYRRLVAAFPEKSKYQMYLAVLLQAVGDNTAALIPLSQILNDPILGESARQMVVEIETEDARQELGWIEVPLRRYGDQYVIQVLLDGDRSAQLLIDTGAAMSVINRDLALTLGYLSDSRGLLCPADGSLYAEGSLYSCKTFITAGGPVVAPIVRLESLALSAEIVTRGLKVGILSVAFNHDISGLLGMDVLSRFEFQLDQENERLRLRYRSVD